MSKEKNDKISLDIFLKNKLSTKKLEKKEKTINFKRLGIDLIIKQIDEFTLEESQHEKANTVNEIKRNNAKILKDAFVYPPVKDREFLEGMGIGTYEAVDAIEEIFTAFEIGELATIVLEFSNIQGNFLDVDKGL